MTKSIDPTSAAKLAGKYVGQRIFGCLASIPAALAVFLILFARGVSWPISASIGALIEATAILYCALAICRLKKAHWLGTFDCTLNGDGNLYSGNCNTSTVNAHVFAIFLTSSRTTAEGTIRIVPSGKSFNVGDISLDATGGGVSLSIEPETSTAVIHLRPGWRRILRSGDFSPIRIRFNKSPPALIFEFSLAMEQKLPRHDEPEIVAVIAEQ